MSVIGGAISWAVNIRIRNETLENNKNTIKEIGSVHDKITKELSDFREKVGDKFERLEKALTRCQTEIEGFEQYKKDSVNRIISVVDGKYVRNDLFQQASAAHNDRLDNFRQLIELYMNKIEEGLNRQIEDLKERLK